MLEVSASLVTSVFALLFVCYLVYYVLSKSQGTERMAEISRAVQIGARAFLKREYMYVTLFVVAVAILMAAAPYLAADVGLSWRTSIAFVAGALCSALAGYVGMSIATRANARTAQGAVEGGLKGALSVAVSGGAVMGLSVAGLALLGLSIVFAAFDGKPEIVNGYAMGASLVALFARSGGGIFTKGADMGADLVGKVEAGIPEDDPRNPAVIADNVGDNVGDVAGLGADLLESYVESIIASMAIAAGVGLGVAVVGGESVSRALQLLPLSIASVGIVASVIGVIFVRAIGRKNPQTALMAGTYLSAILTAIGTFIVVKRADVSFDGHSPLGPFYATIFGIAAGIIVGFVSEYFTSGKYKPVKRLAESTQSGPAIAVTGGIAVGMQSTAVPVIVLAASVVAAYHFAGIYGVAMAALGMLATTGMVVAVDSYGPIADNAGGIAEMSKLDPSVRKITDNLDAVGNTTAAIGKGFAIGSAAFAALGLLAAYLKTVGIESADIQSPRVMAGLLVGGMLPFLFSSMLFGAVGNSAFKMIEEVRTQFRTIPGQVCGYCYKRRHQGDALARCDGAGVASNRRVRGRAGRAGRNAGRSARNGACSRHPDGQ